jgi:sulfur carrier protein
MEVHINQHVQQLPDGATLADAIAVLQARPPFAVAVNLQFVPRASYSRHLLQDGDHIEIVAPITGG